MRYPTFTLLSTQITCLVSFALTSFTDQHETKEVGLRKVLRAFIYGTRAVICQRHLLVTQLVTKAQIIHSYLSESTGFAIAALMDW